MVDPANPPDSAADWQKHPRHLSMSTNNNLHRHMPGIFDHLQKPASPSGGMIIALHPLALSGEIHPNVLNQVEENNAHRSIILYDIE
jgi:hypothetical protein